MWVVVVWCGGVVGVVFVDGWLSTIRLEHKLTDCNGNNVRFDRSSTVSDNHIIHLSLVTFHDFCYDQRNRCSAEHSTTVGKGNVCSIINNHKPLIRQSFTRRNHCEVSRVVRSNTSVCWLSINSGRKYCSGWR